MASGSPEIIKYGYSVYTLNENDNSRGVALIYDDHEEDAVPIQHNREYDASGVTYTINGDGGLREITIEGKGLYSGKNAFGIISEIVRNADNPTVIYRQGSIGDE